MQLTQPFALWILGLIPVIVLIHSLKPKLRHVAVTDFFLWRQVLRETRSGLSLSKILARLSLLLQILIVILAALALAQPVWQYTGRPAGHAIIILDGSASMQTRTPAGTRFDEARSRAREIIAALSDRGQAMLIQSGPQPSLLSPFTNDIPHLMRILGAAQPTDTPGGLARALHLALSFLDPARDDRVYLITDGAGGEAQDLFAIHPRVRTVLIEGGGRNVGITGFSARPVPDTQDSFQIMTAIKNYLPHPVLCPLRITLDGRLVVEETVGLDAGQHTRHILPWDGPLTGTAIARLDLQDDFTADNSAFMVLQGSRKIWVLLVGPGHFFLEKALAAFPDVMVNRIPAIVPSSWADQISRNDIVIIDRVPAPPSEKGNFLLIDALSPSLPLTGEARIDHPRIVAWDRDSPLMAGVDLRGLYIADARRVSSADGARLVAAARQTGLIYTYEHNALRMVYLGFDPAASDLPLRVAFPVLVGNVLEYLVPRSLRFDAVQARAGEPFVIRPAPGTRSLTIRDPAGKWAAFDPGSGSLRYDQTLRTGIYTVAEDDRRYAFGVSLANAAESDIHPAQPLPVDASADSSSPEKVPLHAGLWAYLLMALVLITALEWGLWMKGRG